MNESAQSAGNGPFSKAWRWAELRPRLAIVLVCLMALLPGFFVIPPVDRDESRYAQASRQMLETGDFVEIRFQDEARNKKPAGIYWMQVASATFFGGAQAPIWAYRIPSLLGAIGAALATFWVGAVLFDRRIALLGALLLGTCLSATFEGHIAKTDAMLLFTVVLAQGVMAHAYLSARRGEAAPGWGLTTLFWVAQGVGLLIKGPITPMVSVLTFAALAIADRDIKWGARLRPLTGILIAGAIALPWLIAIWVATDGAFFAEAVGGDMVGKIGSGQERHWGPPGYHLALLSVFFWPASFLVWPALRHTWATRASDVVRFCIAWIVPTWIVFEITSTKLPHYVLPTYPALALLVAAFVFSDRRNDFGVWRKAGLAIWVLTALLVAAAAVFLPAYYGAGIHWLHLPLALVIAAAALRVGWSAWKGVRLRTQLGAIVVGMVAMATAFQLTLPALTDLALSPRLAAAVERNIGTGDPATASAGFSEPSLVFLLGTDTVLGAPETAADHLAATPGAVALVTGEHQDRFLARATALGLTMEARETVEGFNYSGGDPLTITVYRAPEVSE
jgi:4-amino-4-deoxy-L-arabinose transferase-like glycosyltransferase